MRQALSDRLLPSEALDAAGQLVAAFPNGGGNAGGAYIGALGAILCEYPRAAALKCCDLTKGVTRETKFLPTVADIVAFCERETAEMRRPVERAETYAEAQARITAAVEDDRRLAEARRGRLTLEQLRAKYGPNWGLATGRKPSPTREQSAQELIAAIGQEAFDAIPDAGIRTDDWQKLRAPKPPEAAE